MEAPKNVEGAYLTEVDPVAALALDLLRAWVGNKAANIADATSQMAKLGGEFSLLET